ncbi:zinc ribbon domain-containing protein [Lachnoanaerobaculum gingivalis]|uniref:Zinc ribbon domain-containing protein n=1 Tax=Lachnoanaerobaculum gingivalis TaxID=2490855 RepID=A0A3P3QXG1_9FIRM|nr:zinc ribbon domain-containing protein [Lachnoanaerobaculum gingivalis]RRJ25825.1 zinc ribbon domain-containing protein [Lachnoanaerobaculum gingivalis]
MKNKLKYLICILAFLLLTACGGVVKTDMNFDDSFAGSRVMTYTISNSDYTSYVQKDFATVAETLKALCPEDIEITSVTQDDSNIVAVFTINFSSKDDYEKKVGNILKAVGSDIEPKVTLLRSNTAFAKGVAFQENFGTEDLLKWMSDGIINNDYITSSYEVYIFSTSQVSLNIAGEEYEKDANMSIIDVNTTKYLPINGVEFNTVINKDGSIDRSIALNIPNTSYDQAKDDIDKFMVERSGEVGTGTWSEANNSHIFTVEGKALSAEDCKKMTEKFTGKSLDSKTGSDAKDNQASEETQVESESEKSTEESTEAISDSSDAVDKRHLFSKNYTLNEYINLEDYISNYNNAVSFDYYVNPDNNYEGTITDGTGYSTTVSRSAMSGESKTLLYSGYSSTFDIKLDVNILPNVSKYKHIVEITPTGKIKRNITVVFSESFNENDANSLEEKLKSILSHSKIKLDKVSLNGKDLEVKISSSGTMDEDAKMWEETTGYSRSISSLDIDKKGYFVTKQEISFMDDFNPEIFTSGNVDSYEYIVKNAGKPVDRGLYIDGSFENAEAKFKGNDFIVKGENVMMSNYIAPFFVSVRTNFTIYIIFAAVAFIFILIIAVLLLILFKKSKKNKNDAQVRDIPVAEAPVNTTSNTVSIKKDEAKLNDEANPNDKVFCSNCGQENNAGDKFCSSCGKEIL